MDIKVFANFRDICGGKIVSINIVDGDSILNVLKQLISRFPEMKEELFTEAYELKPLNHVFINGKNIIYLDGLDTKVYQKDLVALFPPVAGG
ncbi:ubiquitin-like small modifier protein 1 [Desertibacillus haloalkaliphilus]|uniref:ubiquitin-like small modifier protein 1 n=1 Tax=Desertibacillus haloalkaliphilus TaxID=1328930 RepID=UPI001C26A821|nr:MoaD family protein [Desertibacillus haloalkaliphilus]